MWYSQGTISATSNNTIINGTGTAFIQGVRVGDGITIAGSTSLHEVISIASNTQMTIKPAYTGATGSGKQYAVAPILGYDKYLSDAFNQLRLQFGGQLSSLQPWAYAATASAALDALGFSESGEVVATGTAAQGREGLGLGTAATKSVVSSNNDTTEGRLLQVGSGGWMSNGFKSPKSGIAEAVTHTSTFAWSGGAGFPSAAGQGLTLNRSELSDNHILLFPFNQSRMFLASSEQATGEIVSTVEMYTTGNTTVDSNGFIKSSSPVINLYTDKHDLHNESQFGATPAVTRKSKGVYEITGTLGLRSDGWYLDTPSDRNGNKYFNIEWTQNITPEAIDGVVDEYRDGIVVTIETFERVWNKETGVFENGAPMDINELQDRFVQLRFNELKVEHEELDDETITRNQE